MAQRFWLLWLMCGLGPTLAAAQTPIRLQGLVDVYFQWRPMPKGSVMCGYAVLGNHMSHEDPKIEWDIYVDEIVKGSERVAAVSAGTFTVQGKTRTPRAPITELSFSVEGDSENIAAQIVGAPNVDNAIRGVLDPGRAATLFSAFSNEQKISANIRYSDGTSDQLTFAGFRDSRSWGSGKNSPFDECLRGVTPRIRNTHTLP